MALVDTNVLVYASDATAPQHAASLRLRDAVVVGELRGAMAIQNLLEFYAVITTPKGLAPRSPSEAHRELVALEAYFTILPMPDRVAQTAIQRAGHLNLRRAEIYDAVIAITALAAEVTTIFTYDTIVFRRFPGLIVRSPNDWGAEPSLARPTTTMN